MKVNRRAYLNRLALRFGAAELSRFASFMLQLHPRHLTRTLLLVPNKQTQKIFA